MMTEVKTVYWAELQSGLSEVGLNASVGMPDGTAWGGEIDDLPFVMSISPVDDDGFRSFMIISLCGQDEDSVVVGLNKFMGYSPFCKYSYKSNSQITVTYEWAKDAGNRFEQLGSDERVADLTRLEDGFKDLSPPDPASYYQDFSLSSLPEWEEAIANDPNLELGGARAAEIIPFIKLVSPHFGKQQSLFGLSIISLPSRVANEPAVVSYGLQPLLNAGIVTEGESNDILSWYKRTEPRWDSGGGGVIKMFKLGDVTYQLVVDSYRCSRDLILQVVH